MASIQVTTGKDRPEKGAVITDLHSNGVPARRLHQRGWDALCRSPIRSLWNLQGARAGTIARLTWESILGDRLFGRAAELAFYFLFALFPTLLSASSILGLVARSANQFYDKLLNYLSLVVPAQALGTVLLTFNETTANATTGKLTFGLAAAIWSASVGISAIQDSLNAVYKVQPRRSFFVARLQAIGLTIVLAFIVTLILSAMLGGDFVAAIAAHHIENHFLVTLIAIAARLIGWTISTALLAISFALIYQWAPDLEIRKWRWLTPGSAFGIVGWLLASLSLRLYLTFFNSYSITYGSLGAVIILLTWFYITGLMILVGAEINSGIETAKATNDSAIRLSMPNASKGKMGAPHTDGPTSSASDVERRQNSPFR